MRRQGGAIGFVPGLPVAQRNFENRRRHLSVLIFGYQSNSWHIAMNYAFSQGFGSGKGTGEKICTEPLVSAGPCSAEEFAGCRTHFLCQDNEEQKGGHQRPQE